MSGKWFANRGQVIQTVAASLSAAVALVVLYFLLKNNNSLPKTSSVLYVLGITSLLLIGFVFGRRSVSQIAPVGQKDRKLIEFAADGTFAPLQEDALRLSVELLTYLKRLGPAPAPKYTVQDIEKMTSAQMKVLIDAHDGDFAEACEYHSGDGKLFVGTGDAYGNQITARWKRLYPWYQKVAASYALEFKDKVEKIRNRFAVEGITDDVLLLPVEGKEGEKHIRAIAMRLWELAFKIGENGINL